MISPLHAKKNCGSIIPPLQAKKKLAIIPPLQAKQRVATLVKLCPVFSNSTPPAISPIIIEGLCGASLTFKTFNTASVQQLSGVTLYTIENGKYSDS